MTVKLTIEEGREQGASASLDVGVRWLIGSDPAACVLIVDDPAVLREHLAIEKREDGYVVVNLSDSSSALLNGKEIGKEGTPLEKGDLLKIGETKIRFDDIPFPLQEEPLEEETGTFVSDLSLEEVEQMAAAAALEKAQATSPSHEEPEEEEKKQDTVFTDTQDEVGALAEIDFGLVDAGRWLLKIIGGPNNGAEFYMHAGSSYLLGTDPKSCDIVFYDTSVSRQHARIIVTPEEALFIEDLKSKNGLQVGGVAIHDKEPLPPGVIVKMGTTSFVVYDREGEMQTIISPILPEVARELETKGKEESESSIEEEAEAPVREREDAMQGSSGHTRIVLLAVAAFLFLVIFGMYSLFQEKPVVMQVQENANELIAASMKPFPAVLWTYNKSNGSLLLSGHVLTTAERNQIRYNIASLKFIKNVDDTGLIIDESAAHEINSLLSQNKMWKGIAIHPIQPGQFVITGELQTRKQAEQLFSYLNVNFSYVDLLKKKVVVDEEVEGTIAGWLREAKLVDVTVKMNEGDVTLSGSISKQSDQALQDIIEKIKQMNGVRVVMNMVSVQAVDTGKTIDISSHYVVSGKSRVGDKYTVVINGRLLSAGDELDGMKIETITAHRITLVRGNDHFRIDY